MNSLVIISSDGQIGETCQVRSQAQGRIILRLKDRMVVWNLQPTKLFLNKSDYDDIVKWQNAK
jgi:hypothetical protein